MPHGKEKGGQGGRKGDAILLHTTCYPQHHCKLLEFLTKEAIIVHGLFYQLLSLLSGNYKTPINIICFLDRIKENETNDLVVIIHFINFAYGI